MILAVAPTLYYVAGNARQSPVPTSSGWSFNRCPLMKLYPGNGNQTLARGQWGLYVSETGRPITKSKWHHMGDCQGSRSCEERGIRPAPAESVEKKGRAFARPVARLSLSGEKEGQAVFKASSAER